MSMEKLSTYILGANVTEGYDYKGKYNEGDVVIKRPRNGNVSTAVPGVVHIKKQDRYLKSIVVDFEDGTSEPYYINTFYNRADMFDLSTPQEFVAEFGSQAKKFCKDHKIEL